MIFSDLQVQWNRVSSPRTAAVATWIGYWSQMAMGSSHDTRNDGPVTVRMGSRSRTQEPFGAAFTVTRPLPTASSIAGVSP